ncbi:odorant receptor 4-like [Tribolium madens]|uniref:odorant receptor 4-like n=1 Tax=Tribolium madens TaxID=41895 RepID=UPI001CF7671F|nr:odorant receptor 4-like [Tribolium madens]
MANFKWTKIIETNIVVMKAVGMWPEKSFFTWDFYNIFFYFMVTFLLVIHVLLQTIQMVRIIDDFRLFQAAFSLALQQYNVLIKLLYYIVKFPKLKKFFHVLNNYQVFQPHNHDQEKMLESKLSAMKKYYIFLFYFMTFIAVSSLILYPIFDNLNSGERELLLICWFPYDYKTSPYYQLTYFYQSVSITFAVFIVLQIDTLALLLMTYIGLQCDLLCDNFRQLGYESSKNSNIESGFVNCIKHHQNLIKLSNHCADFTYMLIFVIVATSSIAIGVTLSQVFLKVSSFNIIFLVVYILTVIFQMFQYCWFGSEIMYKSDKIPYSAFEMNFLDAPLSTKKNLVIFLTCTQKPIQMPILKVTHLSLQTFMKVLQTAWSYFALLIQLSR